MTALCIYCGSASGVPTGYAAGARALAQVLVSRQITLVYGGGKIGLMGILADEALRLGGRVIGVIPQALLEREVAHQHLSQLHIVADMHARKARMASLSDGFIALPGGLGTLEELFEMLTWLQLNLHQKPVGLLNVAGYFDSLLQFLDHSTREGFVSKSKNSPFVGRKLKGLVEYTICGGKEVYKA